MGPVLEGLRDLRTLALALGISAFTFLIYAAIPFGVGEKVDIGLFIAITPSHELLAFTVISLLSGIVFSLHLRAFHLRRHDPGHIGLGLAGLLSGFFSAILGGVSCGPCIAIFLSVLGAGGAAFVAEHRFEASLVAIALLCISLHLTSKVSEGRCESCGAPRAQA